MDRRDELALNLAETRERITASCLEAGRNVDDVTLIVVTKTWPASDTEILFELGATDVGENRDQDARIKHDELGHLALTWHAIGQIQTNKAKSIAQWADVVHAVDRSELVVSLAKASASREFPLKALVQVNLDPSPSEGRGGCLPVDALRIAREIDQADGLEIAGVMGVAPLNGDAERAFSALQSISREVISQFPQASWISAGMSDDFHIALKFGATHLRIGSSILGHRSFKG